jgi:threonine synthase
VCASNKNNVLTQFIETGSYRAKREFYQTSSPSMDILVSSNLERLLYHVSESDTQVKSWMRTLAETGEYTVDSRTLNTIQETFAAGWAGEDAVFRELRQVFETRGYLCDPHTAVAFGVARRQKGEAPMVVLSTASPFKFSVQVLGALGQSAPRGEWQALDALQAFSGSRAPICLAALRGSPERFTQVINPEDIPQIPLSL